MRCLSLLLPSLLIASVVTVPVPVFAQHMSPDADSVGRTGIAQPETPPSRFRALRRIVRGLDTQVPGTSGAALRIEVDLEVIGVAPTPLWLNADDLATSAPTYGAPTHDELLTALTPVPLRSTAPYRRLRPSWSMER